MPKYEKESKIKILKTEHTVSNILKTVAFYPAEYTETFFKDLNMSFPRELRIDVLREVLRPHVLNTRVQRSSLADEMNYRLSWFNQYTEVQLTNLFAFYKDIDLEKEYLEQLWLAIFENITDRNISEEDFQRLIDLSVEHSKANGLVQPDIISYNNKLNTLFHDKKDKIDGLKQDEIRPVLYKSSTITEIRQLGNKYGVDVPKRLKKSQLIDIIVAEMKDRAEYKDELEADLKKMSIIVLQRYAIKNNIKASTELKKEEVIEYILSNAKETKESYFVPSSSVYELEASDLGESMPEVVAPVVEEVVPEVEEPVEEIKKEVIEEKVVAPAPVDDSLVKELIAAMASNQQPVMQAVAQEKTFAFTEVNETYLNIVEVHGAKPKKALGEMNDGYDLDSINEEESTPATVQTSENVAPVKKKKSGWKVLLNILFYLVVTLIVIFIIAVIYVGLTPTPPASMAKFEAFIDGIFGLNSLTWLRTTFHKLIS